MIYHFGYIWSVLAGWLTLYHTYFKYYRPNCEIQGWAHIENLTTSRISYFRLNWEEQIDLSRFHKESTKSCYMLQSSPAPGRETFW